MTNAIFFQQKLFKKGTVRGNPSQEALAGM
jgi:hypothetical protein